jgi:hypothetical protein
LEDLSLEGRVILKWGFKMWCGEVWSELLWHRIGTGGGRFWMRRRTFGFHKMRWISRLAVVLLASQEGLWSMYLVTTFYHVSY